jgi:hypothetical protein
MGGLAKEIEDFPPPDAQAQTVKATAWGAHAFPSGIELRWAIGWRLTEDRTKGWAEFCWRNPKGPWHRTLCTITPERPVVLLPKGARIDFRSVFRS